MVGSGCEHVWLVGVPAASPPGTALGRICCRCGERDTRTLRMVGKEGDWTWVCPCGARACKLARQRLYQRGYVREVRTGIAVAA